MRRRASGIALILTLLLGAGCAEAEPTGSADVSIEAPGDEDEAAEGVGADGDIGEPEDAAPEGEGEDASTAAECPEVDWREDDGGSFEGSLGPVPEPRDDDGKWVIDEHGPVAFAVPGTWVPAPDNEAQPEVWGYEAPIDNDADSGVFITGICGGPIIGVDGTPLDLNDPVRSGGLDALVGEPDALPEGPAAYTALWKSVWDGFMSMRYDFVALDDDVVVVLISQALEPHLDALEGEHAEVMDAVVDSVGRLGHVDCPPVATGCVDQRDG